MIVSTTITSQRASIIGDALRSVVGYVDQCLVFDIGADQATIDAAREAAGDKLHVIEMPLADMSTMRNRALDTAEDLKARWAVTVDTDERLHLPQGFRGGLSHTRGDMLIAFDSDGSYSKERIFRIPAKGRWEGGDIHEHFVPEEGSTVGVLTTMTFSELPKSEKELEEAAIRRLPELERRWKEERTPFGGYYLAENLEIVEGTERLERAAEVFLNVANMDNTPPELRAWSCFRAAKVLLKLDLAEDAATCAAKAFTFDPRCAEAAWLLGKLEPWAARVWLDVFKASLQHQKTRLWFRDPRILREGAAELERLVRGGA